MEIQALINRQRVKYIIESYALAGDEVDAFNLLLNDLFDAYQLACIELAFAEVLVEGWSEVPMVRGLTYLSKVRDRLRHWCTEGVSPRLTSAQFEQITGLDATATFKAIDSAALKDVATQAGEARTAATPDL